MSYILHSAASLCARTCWFMTCLSSSACPFCRSLSVWNSFCSPWTCSCIGEGEGEFEDKEREVKILRKRDMTIKIKREMQTNNVGE
jgi:hypothetical protein